MLKHFEIKMELTIDETKAVNVDRTGKLIGSKRTASVIGLETERRIDHVIDF
jgi:hypothetical protein